MKTTITSLLFAACVVSIAGCSSTRTKIDTGPIPARTFSFISTQGKTVPDFAEKKQEIHALIQGAITQGLERRQVSRVQYGGDVTVAYLLITGNNAVTTSINDYFGYGRDSAALLDVAHDKYSSSQNPNYFEAGTLVIDIIDSTSWKVLKRGYATRALVANLTPEQRAARLNEVVEEILKDVRFKQ